MSQLTHFGALAILIVTVVLSLLGLNSVPGIVSHNLFRPYYFLRHRQYLTIFSSGFIHADMGHLLFNMVTFYFFAFPLERFLGTPRFLALYAIGLVLSHSCSFVKHKNNPQYASLGASGAISAVLFAYIVFFPTTTLFIIPIPFPIPAVLFAVAYMAYSWYSARNPRGPINHDAHLCGGLAGLLFVLATNPGAYLALPALLSR